MAGQISLLQLQEAILSALTLVRDEVDTLLSSSNQTSTTDSDTVRALFAYQSERSKTISLLTSHGLGWDAEIILRAFYEVSAKILLICFSPPETRTSLCDEFWLLSGSVSARRRAQRADFAKAVFPEDDFTSSVFSLLQDERLFDLSKRLSKSERRNLERKWSFSEIIGSLDQLALQGAPTVGIKSLLHMYDTASHLLHADSEAMVLMADRATRKPKELLVLELCHTARIWSDQFAISRYCAFALARYMDQPSTYATRIAEAAEAISMLSKPLLQEFESSQRDFYARYESE